jgi:hypothetical protein
MTYITRRGFFQQAGIITASGLALSGALPRPVTKSALAQPMPDWLSLTEEPALEPELPIIAPHHHLWDRPNNRYMLE